MKPLGMRAKRHAILIAVLIAAAGMAPAQTSAPSGTPPETLVPSDDARIFFDRVESLAASGQGFPDLPDEELAPVDAFIAAMLEPAARDPNWFSTGVDLHALAETRAGGAAAHMLLAPGPFGEMTIHFVDEPPEDLVGLEWAPIASFGDLPRGADVRTEFGRISPKVLLVERVALRREGNASCYERSESRLYSNRQVPAAEADMMAFVMFLRMREMLDQRRLCMVWIEIEPGRYASRWFDAQGHRIPGLDWDELRYSLVTRAPAEAEPSAE